MAGKQGRGWKEGLGGGCWTELGHGSRKTPQEAGFCPAHRVAWLEGQTQGWTWPGGAIILWHGGVAGSLPPCDSGNSGMKAGFRHGHRRDHWGEGKGKDFRRWGLTGCSGKAWISGEVLWDGDHVRVHGSNEETEHSVAVAWIQ